MYIFKRDMFIVSRFVQYNVGKEDVSEGGNRL